MRRHSDDDLYRIHSRWLGPAGRTLPLTGGVPMKGIPVGAAAAVLALVTLRAVGVSGLPLWVLVAASSWAIAKGVLSVTGDERPVRALVALIVSEVTAPRPAGDAPEAAVLSPGSIRVRQPRGHTRAEGHRR